MISVLTVEVIYLACIVAVAAATAAAGQYKTGFAAVSFIQSVSHGRRFRLQNDCECRNSCVTDLFTP